MKSILYYWACLELGYEKTYLVLKTLSRACNILFQGGLGGDEMDTYGR